jgi:hypothetical protein
MKNVITKVAVCLLLSGTIVSIAHADEATFKKKHPRRAQVLGRDKNIKNKDNAAVASGAIDKHQDKVLNKQTNQIHREEQRDAAKNGGKITTAEQNKMNGQEDKVNRERTNMESRDAAAKAGGAPAAPAAPVAAPATSN